MVSNLMRRPSWSSRRGFTGLELLVTLLIVATLSSIVAVSGVPAYRAYSARSSLRVEIERYAAQQERFYSRRSVYAAAPANLAAGVVIDTTTLRILNAGGGGQRWLVDLEDRISRQRCVGVGGAGVPGRVSVSCTDIRVFRGAPVGNPMTGVPVGNSDPSTNTSPTAGLHFETGVPLVTVTAAGVDQSVQIVSTATDPDGDIVTGTLDLGDGRTLNLLGASVSYPTPGIYTVTQTAGDGRGGTATATAVITISANLPPTGVLAVSPAGPYNPGDTLTFSISGATDPDGTLNPSVSWSFGDGVSVAGGLSIRKVYSVGGNYVATATLRDDLNAATVLSANLTINRAPSQPVLSCTPTTVYQSDVVSCSVSSGGVDPDGDPITWSWSVSDRQSSSGASATYRFDTPGAYVVTATATDPSGALSNGTFPVTVIFALPVSVAITPGDTTLPTGASVTATATITGGTLPITYVWQRLLPTAQALGSSSSEALSFVSPGVYSYAVSVSDARSMSDADTVSVTVNNRAPDTPNLSCAADTVALSTSVICTAASSDPDGGTVSFTFSATDRISASGNTATYTRASVGNTVVTVTARDGQTTAPNGEGVSASSLARTITFINADPPPAPSSVSCNSPGVQGWGVCTTVQSTPDPGGRPLTHEFSFDNGVTWRTAVAGLKDSLNYATPTRQYLTVRARSVAVGIPSTTSVSTVLIYRDASAMGDVTFSCSPTSIQSGQSVTCTASGVTDTRYADPILYTLVFPWSSGCSVAALNITPSTGSLSVASTTENAYSLNPGSPRCDATWSGYGGSGNLSVTLHFNTAGTYNLRANAASIPQGGFSSTIFTRYSPIARSTHADWSGAPAWSGSTSTITVTAPADPAPGITDDCNGSRTYAAEVTCTVALSGAGTIQSVTLIGSTCGTSPGMSFNSGTGVVTYSSVWGCDDGESATIRITTASPLGGNTASYDRTMTFYGYLDAAPGISDDCNGSRTSPQAATCTVSLTGPGSIGPVTMTGETCIGSPTISYAAGTVTFNSVNGCQDGETITINIRTISPLGFATADYARTMTWYGYYAPSEVAPGVTNDCQGTRTFPAAPTCTLALTGAGTLESVTLLSSTCGVSPSMSFSAGTVTYSDLGACQTGQTATIRAGTRSTPLGNATATYDLTMTFNGYRDPSIGEIFAVGSAANSTMAWVSGYGTDLSSWAAPANYLLGPTSYQPLTMYPGYESAIITPSITSSSCPLDDYSINPLAQSGFSNRSLLVTTDVCERTQSAPTTENASAANDISVDYTATYNSNSVPGSISANFNSAPPSNRVLWSATTFSIPYVNVISTLPGGTPGLTIRTYSGAVNTNGGREYDPPAVWWGPLQGLGWQYHAMEGYGLVDHGTGTSTVNFPYRTMTFDTFSIAGTSSSWTVIINNVSCGGTTPRNPLWKDKNGAEFGLYGLVYALYPEFC